MGSVLGSERKASSAFASRAMRFQSLGSWLRYASSVKPPLSSSSSSSSSHARFLRFLASVLSEHTAIAS